MGMRAGSGKREAGSGKRERGKAPYVVAAHAFDLLLTANLYTRVRSSER
jgi:hypothetical protein